MDETCLNVEEESSIREGSCMVKSKNKDWGSVPKEADARGPQNSCILDKWESYLHKGPITPRPFVLRTRAPWDIFYLALIYLSDSHPGHKLPEGEIMALSYLYPP